MLHLLTLNCISRMQFNVNKCSIMSVVHIYIRDIQHNRCPKYYNYESETQSDYIAWRQLSVCVCLGMCTYLVYRYTGVFGSVLPVLQALEALRYSGILVDFCRFVSLSAQHNPLTTQHTHLHLYPCSSPCPNAYFTVPNTL